MSKEYQSAVRLCEVLYDLCGVLLDDSKLYLIENRVGGLMRKMGYKNYDQLADAAKRSDASSIRDSLVDALTTNETYFFRDQQVFTGLSNHLVRQIEQDSRKSGVRPKLRIWSSACSTGQEIYSVLFTLATTIENLDAWDLTLLATDVSPAAVAQARSGTYAEHEVTRGLPQAQRDKFLSQTQTGWQVLPQWRNRITFGQHNLINDLASGNRFDVILCRNVTIYFDAKTRKLVFEKLTRRLVPEGYLFVGGSETLLDLGDAYKPHRLGAAVCYRPQMHQAAIANPQAPLNAITSLGLAGTKLASPVKR
ncbi:MAG TPA: chemotaxis protein CheR [Planctomycetaceae bacterium]|nr:chemotaxis protein CheR [Planctomycetaceae bacterium]